MSPVAPVDKGAKAQKKPEVHVHPTVGVYVTDATEAAVVSLGECNQLLEYGNAMRMVAATAWMPNNGSLLWSIGALLRASLMPL